MNSLSWFQQGQLFLFFVAGAALCFGFGVRTALTAHWWFWLMLGEVICLSQALPVRGLGGHKNLGENTARTGDPN